MAGRRDDGAGLPGIPLAQSRLSADADERPWTHRLSLFLKALSVVELLKGLAYWGALIGSGGAPDPLAGVAPRWLLACSFFAVADPVAAVGLWIGAGWGVVIWLLAALGQLSITLLTSDVSWAGSLATSVIMALMAGYIFLAIKARKEDL